MVFEIKMTKEDQILLNLISSPIAIKNKSTLNALFSLEKKYPENLGIKRKIVNFYKENGQNKEAVFKLIFIVKRFLQREDITLLILLAFQTGLLNHIFFQLNEIRLLERHECFNFEYSALNILRSKSPEINFEKYLSKQNYSIEPGSLSKIYDYSYKFNNVYTVLLLLAQEGKFIDFFELSKLIFRTKSFHETIEILMKYQKIEILHCLSLKNKFFSNYFTELSSNISKELILAIEVSLSTKDLDTLIKLSKILKEQSDDVVQPRTKEDSVFI